jgi:uncharacterized MnhB-related membrane protein
MKLVAFRVFKWTVYALLALDTLLFLSVVGKVTAFVDGAAWLVLLGVMEYESSTLGEGYSGRWEKLILTGLNLFAYSMILTALYGYVMAGEWLDAVNAGTWMGVCAVLVYQMYAAGAYGRTEYRLITAIKVVLYLVLIICAVLWTMNSQKALDAADAWLWLLCFAVIELNVFGFENGEEPDAEAAVS